ncbi:MAG: amidotransferase [Candidatus Hydrogenedentes bacterium]|nr:amidotransferase [Candidatus Hydrogenedentota bacterium]
MRIHCLQHVPFEGLGFIERWVQTKGHPVSRTRWFGQDSATNLQTLDWLIVMGGPMGVHDEEEHPWLIEEKRLITAAIHAEKTVLGICLGAQLIADVLGAPVYRNRHREIGWLPITLTEAGTQSPLFEGFPRKFDVFHWHGDTFDLPAGAQHMAFSEACVNQAFVYNERVVGLQFHLETTPQGLAGLINNCGGEIVEAPFIQSPRQMTADSGRFDAINGYMGSLLDRLGALTVKPSVGIRPD